MTQQHMTKAQARQVAKERARDDEYVEWLREQFEHADDEAHHDMSETLRVIEQIDKECGHA